jgi:hypothetical protein
MKKPNQSTRQRQRRQSVRRERNHAADYARRKAQGLAKGLTLAQARGHASRPGTARIKVVPKSKAELALRLMKEGKTKRAAAKEAGIGTETLTRYLAENVTAKRQGRRWIIVDERARIFPVYSEGQLKAALVGLPEATKASEYMRSVDRFLTTGKRELLAPFEGGGVLDVNGEFVPFETDPNALYQLDAAGELFFPEIYKIVA